MRILESESEWMIAHLVLVRYGRERRVLHDGCRRRRSRLWPWTAASRRTTAAVCWCRWRIAASAPPSPCLPATHPRTASDIVGTETCDARRQTHGVVWIKKRRGRAHSRRSRPSWAPAPPGSWRPCPAPGCSAGSQPVHSVFSVWFGSVYTVFILRFIRFYT